MQFNEYSEKEKNLVKDIVASLSKEMPVAVLKDKRLWTITTIEDFEDGREKTVHNDIDQLAFSRLFEEANAENGKISVIQKETNNVVVKIFQNGKLNDFNNFPSVVKINDENIIGKYLNEDWKNISVEDFSNLCHNDENVEAKRTYMVP